MGDAEREAAIAMAQVAEQAERYDDMVAEMKKVATKPGVELSIEERNLLSVAYKNVIGSRRASWRFLAATKETESDEKKLKAITEYKEKVEKELTDLCNDILTIINDHLLPAAKDDESKVFYQKMKGDYHRYTAEFSEGDKRKKAAEEALSAYQAAYDIAQASKDINPCHPIRLGLALNFSVFYYEIIASPEKACKLAKSAFDEAVEMLDQISEESYRDATLIMQLLRDNLRLWSGDDDDDDAGDDEDDGGEEKKEGGDGEGGD